MSWDRFKSWTDVRTVDLKKDREILDGEVARENSEGIKGYALVEPCHRFATVNPFRIHGYPTVDPRYAI